MKIWGISFQFGISTILSLTTQAMWGESALPELSSLPIYLPGTVRGFLLVRMDVWIRLPSTF